MKKPIYKRWYVWVLGFIVLSFIIYPFLPEADNETAATYTPTEAYTPEPTPEATSEPTPTPEPIPEATPEPTPEPEPTPAPVGYIISAPDEGRRNQNLTIVFQGEPYTQYTLSVFSAAGTALTAAGLGSATSDADGVVSWTWLVGGATGAGTQRVTITGGGVTVRHEILIIVD